MMLFRGSYHNGLAPRDFEPAYPELWNGCVGAWCPSLGPTGTILRDWSGRQLHGTLTDTTLTTIWAVNSGHCLLLDGMNDYVSVAHHSVFDITARIALSMWFKTSVGTSQYLLSKDNDSFLLGTGIVTSGRLGVFLSGPSVAWLESTVNVDDGLWHHACATYDGATIKLYIDGLLDNSSARTGAITTGTAPVKIGWRTGGNYFNGLIDDVRIYNRDLRSREVIPLYSGGRGRGIAYSYNRPTPLFYTAPDAGGSSGGTFPGMAWRNLRRWRFVVRAGVDGNWPRVT